MFAASKLLGYQLGNLIVVKIRGEKMEKRKLIENTAQGKGPKGSVIFYNVTTKDGKIFEHILWCPNLGKFAEICEQTKKDIPKKILRNCVSEFRDKLKNEE